MDSKVTISLFVIISILVASCGDKNFLNSTQLYDFIRNENNGYIIPQQVKDVAVEVMYKPTDLVVLEYLPENYNEEIVKDYRDKFSKNLYFILKISVDNNDLLKKVPQNNNEFANWTNKLTFGMNKEVWLKNENGGQFFLKDYVYPRTYGSSRANTMMFVFSKNASLKNDLIFTLKEFGLGIGELNFRIDSKKILNQPKLNFNYE